MVAVSTASLETLLATVVGPMPVLAHRRFFLVIRVVREIANNTLVQDRSNKWLRSFVDRHLPGLKGSRGTTAVVEAAELRCTVNRSSPMVRLLQIKVCIRKPCAVSQSGILALAAGAIRARRR